MSALYRQRAADLGRRHRLGGFDSFRARRRRRHRPGDFSSPGLANSSIPFRIDDMDLLSVDVNSFTFSADKSLRRLISCSFQARLHRARRVSVQLDRQGVCGRRRHGARAGHAVARGGRSRTRTVSGFRSSRPAGCCSRGGERSTPSCWSTSRTSGGHRIVHLSQTGCPKRVSDRGAVGPERTFTQLLPSPSSPRGADG